MVYLFYLDENKPKKFISQKPKLFHLTHKKFRDSQELSKEKDFRKTLNSISQSKRKDFIEDLGDQLKNLKEKKVFSQEKIKKIDKESIEKEKKIEKNEKIIKKLKSEVTFWNNNQNQLNSLKIEGSSNPPRLKRKTKIPKLSESISVPEFIEPANYRKYLEYIDFLSKLCQSNGFTLNQRNEQKPYTAYIAKGNNSDLVKRLMKNKWWWKIIEKPENDTKMINMYWSQFKNNLLRRSYKN